MEATPFAKILYGPDCVIGPHGASSVHVAKTQEDYDAKRAAGWTTHPPGGAPLTLHPFTDPVPDSELVDALGDAMNKRLSELPEEEPVIEGDVPSQHKKKKGH